MPIERQQIQHGIQSGNFGRSGTPLPLGSGQAGPDFGRLLKSLGVIGGKVAEDRQEVNVDAAAAAIREVTLQTKVKPKDMTDDEYRELRIGALNEVRDRFDDQGMFLDIFAGENKAVQTIDKFNGRAKALEVRNTMKQLMENTKGLTLAEREDKLMAAIQDGAAFTESISTGSRQSYLDAITEAGLQNADQLVAEDMERTKNLGVARIYDTGFKETEESLSVIAGAYPDAMKEDLDFFTSSQRNMGENLEAMKDVLRGKLKDVRTGVKDFTHDSVIAGDKSAELLISQAKRYMMPELLDLAEENIDGSGNTIAKFHREEIEKARASINQVRSTTRQNLQNKRNMEVSAGNKERYENLQIDIGSQTREALNNPAKADLATSALSAIQNSRSRLEEEAESGLYKNNGKAYLDQMEYLNYQEALIGKTVGDPSIEAQARALIENRTLTEVWFINNRRNIGPEVMPEIDAFLSPAMGKTPEERASIRLNEQINNTEASAPIISFVTDYQARLEALPKKLASKQAMGTLGGLITTGEAHKAGMLGVNKAIRDKNGEPLTKDEYIEAYNAGFEPLRKRIESHLKEMNALGASKPSETPEGKAPDTSTEAVEEGTPFDEAQSIINDPKASAEEKLEAIEASIKSQPDLPLSAAVREFVVATDGTYDPTNAGDRKILKDLLVNSYGSVSQIDELDLSSISSVKGFLRGLDDDVAGDKEEFMKLVTGKDIQVAPRLKKKVEDTNDPGFKEAFSTYLDNAMKENVDEPVEWVYSLFDSLQEKLKGDPKSSDSKDNTKYKDSTEAKVKSVIKELLKGPSPVLSHSPVQLNKQE